MTATILSALAISISAASLILAYVNRGRRVHASAAAGRWQVLDTSGVDLDTGEIL